MHRAGVLLISHFLFNMRPTWSNTYSVSCWWTSGGCGQWNTWLLLFLSSLDAWVQKIHRIPGHSQLSLLQSDCTKNVSNILIGRKKMILFSIKYLLFILWQFPTYEQYILVISTPNSPIPLYLGTLNVPPFPLHVPFLCFVAHQTLVLPGRLECWFILSTRSFAGLVKWPSFPNDSYFNVFIDVILFISVPYHFWVLCNGFGLPVYSELKI